MLLADKRPNLGIRIVRIAHAQTVGAFGKAFNEFRVDALLNKDARTGGAALAVDREDGEQGGVQRAFNIGIFKNQHRRFTAQFHGVFFQPGVFHDVAPGRRTAGERHGTYVMMTNQRIPCGCAVALYHVQHACRNTGFQRQLTQAVSGQRGEFRHLQHRGIAQRQTRRDLPCGGHKRHVPRRYQRTNAYRLHQRVVEHLVVNRIGLAVHLLADFREKFKVVRSAWDQHIFGLMDRQARVRGFHRGDLRHVLVDQIAQTAHQARTLFHRQIGPFRERLFRCRYRLIDLRFTAGGHICQHFTRCRIGGLEVVVTCNIFAVDPMIYFFHFAVSSLTIRFTRRPTPSTSTTTSSPGTTSDKPFGVPVAIMSPGFRVINSLK